MRKLEKPFFKTQKKRQNKQNKCKACPINKGNRQHRVFWWQNRKRKLNRSLQIFIKLWRKVKDRENEETIQEQKKNSKKIEMAKKAKKNTERQKREQM